MQMDSPISLHLPAQAWTLILAVSVALALWLLRRFIKKLGASALTWQSYVRGQGVVLSAFLFAGVIVGVVCNWFAPIKNQVDSDIKLIEFRQVTMGEGPTYEALETHGYGRVTVLAKALSPASSTVRVKLVPEAPNAAASGGTVLDGSYSSWSRLEAHFSEDHLILIIGDKAPGLTRATQADILIVLATR